MGMHGETKRKIRRIEERLNRLEERYALRPLPERPAARRAASRADPTWKFLREIAGMLVGLEMLLERRDIPEPPKQEINDLVKAAQRLVEDFRVEMRGERQKESTEDTTEESESD